VFDVHERARFFGLVALSHEDSALLEQRPVPLKHKVDRRVEERVPGREQLSLRLTARRNQRFLERDPRIARHNRNADAERLTAVADLCRYVRDLVASRLAPCDLTAQQSERFEEEGADVVRL
jgi:hypothetical protein